MCAVNRPTDMGAIKFLKGRQAGKTYQITKPITALGRDPTRNDIVIDELTVSREHAELVCNNGFGVLKMFLHKIISK